MNKKKNLKLEWSVDNVFDYKLIKNPKNNKSHIDKRKEKIEQGEVECFEWWLCERK